MCIKATRKLLVKLTTGRHAACATTTTTAATAIVVEDVPVVVNAVGQDRGEDSGPRHVQEFSQLWNSANVTRPGTVIPHLRYIGRKYSTT